MAKKTLPSRDDLLQLLDYDPATGTLMWKARPSQRSFTTRWAGVEAFTTVERGYRQGRVFHELHYAHRIIWRMMTGDVPDDIDHINGNRADNRWSNLRNVTRTENLRNRALSSNNKTGVHGVRETVHGTWQVYIGTGNNRTKCVGSFPTREQAVDARRRWETKLGYHQNHGMRLPGMAAPGNPVAVGDKLRADIQAAFNLNGA